MENVFYSFWSFYCFKLKFVPLFQKVVGLIIGKSDVKGFPDRKSLYYFYHCTQAVCS